DLARRNEQLGHALPRAALDGLTQLRDAAQVVERRSGDVQVGETTVGQDDVDVADEVRERGLDVRDARREASATAQDAAPVRGPADREQDGGEVEALPLRLERDLPRLRAAAGHAAVRHREAAETVGPQRPDLHAVVRQDALERELLDGRAAQRAARRADLDGEGARDRASDRDLDRAG